MAKAKRNFNLAFPSIEQRGAVLLGCGAFVTGGEFGLVAAEGVLVSLTQDAAGYFMAVVDTTSAIEELATAIEAALTSYEADPGLPTAMFLGLSTPVRRVSISAWDQALIDLDLYDPVQTVLAAVERSGKEGRKMVVEYRRKQFVHRDNPTLLALAQTMGKTDEDIEAVFVHAEGIDQAAAMGPQEATPA